MQFNLDAVSERYASMARALGFSSSSNTTEAAKTMIAAVEQISARVGLPSRLRDLGVPELKNSQLDELGSRKH